MKQIFPLLCLLSLSFLTKGQSVLIDPSTNQAINVTRNLPEFSLYSTGAIPFAAIKFFKDETFRGGIYYNGFYDGIGITNNSSKPGLYWRSTTERVGIDTYEPRGKLHIKANSLAEEPHLLIQQTNNELGRINFESNLPAHGRWTLSGSINATSSLSRFNIFSSQEGENLMSFTGDGKVGIGVDDPQYTLQIKPGTVFIGSTPASSHLSITTNAISTFNTLYINSSSGSSVQIGSAVTPSNLYVNGFTSLGSNGPAIKTKQFTVSLGGGSDVVIPHGINADGIVGLQAIVRKGGNSYPNSGNRNASASYQYSVYCDDTNCYITDYGSGLDFGYCSLIVSYMYYW